MAPTQAFLRGQKAKLSDLTPQTCVELGIQLVFPGGRTADVGCFGLDAADKLTDDRYFIFYNQPSSPESSIQLLAASGEDQARFKVDLAKLPASIKKLVFTATLDDGEMSQVTRGHLRLCGAGQEAVRFAFTGKDFGREKALILAEIYMRDVWRFGVIGQGFSGGLSALLKNFGGEEASTPVAVPASLGPGIRIVNPPSARPSAPTGGASRGAVPVRIIKPKEPRMSDLDWEILYPGAFPLLKIRLKANEMIKAESDAMVAMSTTVDVEGKLEGGLLGGLGRMLTGEKFFFQTLAARRGPGEALLAPATPGDLQALELDGTETYILQKDGFFASTNSVEITTKMQNLTQGLFSGEGFFVIKASGKGTLFVASFGQIHPIDLSPGEEIIIDNGHLVAWSDRMTYNIEKASAGWISSFTSGEGLVCRFRGPGRVLIQSRNARGFGDWIRQFFPQRS